MTKYPCKCVSGEKERKKIMSEEIKKPVKRRKTNNHLKSPVIGNNGLYIDEGDNTKFIELNREIFNLPDIDLHDNAQVMERLDWYFALYQRYDMKPTVAGMAMALGMSRHTMIAIKNDRYTGGSGYKSALPTEVATSIKKAYFLMENLWESYSVQGKMNPVTSIFLAKNNFDYADKQEMVLTPNQNQDSDYNAEEIKARYLTTTSEDDND